MDVEHRKEPNRLGEARRDEVDGFVEENLAECGGDKGGMTAS
ncbi:hypothetical protein [Pseudarthrobacter sp. B4EP4b]|nr:hypothetical protein [Pseudarthrobacter sp. B4EP4b]